MFVGVVRIHLHLPGSRSLKDRRRVVKALKDRISSRLRVSVAEVGELDLLQSATLGAAVVSNDSAHCDEVLASIVSHARRQSDAVLADVRTEIVSFGAAGSGIERGIEATFEREPPPGGFDE